METVDLKVMVPQAIKQLAFFLLARWLNKNLSPTVESQVRTARAIYTVYLIVSQALCMYIRCGGFTGPWVPCHVLLVAVPCLDASVVAIGIWFNYLL